MLRPRRCTSRQIWSHSISFLSCSYRFQSIWSKHVARKTVQHFLSVQKVYRRFVYFNQLVVFRGVWSILPWQPGLTYPALLNRRWNPALDSSSTCVFPFLLDQLGLIGGVDNHCAADVISTRPCKQASRRVSPATLPPSSSLSFTPRRDARNGRRKRLPVPSPSPWHRALLRRSIRSLYNLSVAYSPNPKKNNKSPAFCF